MGNIIKVLSKEVIPDKPTLLAGRLIVEKCENIHLHYRNMRFDFSTKEFLELAKYINKALFSLVRHPEETEYLILSHKSDLEEKPDYFPSRITVEANLGAIHVHYKNLRLELTKDEFIQYANNMEVSLKELKSMSPRVEMLPLDSINPFDGGHREDPGSPAGFICLDQENHEKVINNVIKAIEEGDRIRPIAVVSGSTPYKRMDGFCRYMAHKRMGFTDINTIICPLATPGCQDGKPITVTDQEYIDILEGKTY